MTDSSVDVVSNPQNAHQSLTTIPAPRTSLPLFTVPACMGGCVVWEGGRMGGGMGGGVGGGLTTSGTCNSDDSSS